MKKPIQLAFAALSLLAPLAASAVEPNVGDFAITKGDFSEIYNTLRFAQPTNVPWPGSFWTYGKDGIAVVPAGQDESPAAKFDKEFSLGTQTVDFEREHHSCSKLPAEQQEACQGWYGHCNAWSAAAIKESEPRVPVQLNGHEYTVADQKAYLTEMWMEVAASYGGTTSKNIVTKPEWVTNPDHPDAKKLNSSGVSNYDSFWDVSPKSLVLLLSNYVGINKIGVVIDRFTGDQVWNQPLAGYRILPLRAEDLGSEVKDGATIYFAKTRMKIYWANDSVPHGIVSQKFDITTTTDDESADYFPNNDYSARLLQFRLFFDAPVVLGADNKITSAGHMIGKGIWHNQEFPPSDPVWYDHEHPDFVWLPTQLYFSSGYGNPTLTASRVYQVTGAPPVVQPPVPVEPVAVASVAPAAEPSAAPTVAHAHANAHAAPAPATPPPVAAAGTEGEVTSDGVRHICKVLLSSFSQQDVVFMKGKIFRTLRRAEILSIMKAEDLKIVGNHVEQPGIFPGNQTLKEVRAALDEAGYKTVD